MANNTWSNYTEKTATPVDADEVMVRDSTDGKNKRLLFGTFWKWVAKKLNEATISELQTENKTVIGALNYLNGKSSINLLQIKANDSFSAALKGKNYVMIAGYFYTPSDCPFSFSTGYYIAFRSSYLASPNVYTIVGINTDGRIECKTVQLQ